LLSQERLAEPAHGDAAQREEEQAGDHGEGVREG